MAQGAVVPRQLRAEWDWIAGYSLIGVAAAVLLYTWIAVSGSHFVSDQLAYIASGGLGGLMLFGLGSVLVVTAGLSDEWRKLNRLEDAAQFPPVAELTDAAVLVRRARIVALVGMAVAVAFLVPAWVRISGNTDPKPGLGALTWAVVGLVLGGLIAALGTLRVQRRIQVRKRRLFGPWALVLAEREPLAAVAAATPAAGAAALAGQVLTAPELTRYHRPGCPALAGLAAHPVDLRRIPPTLEPCDLCEADVLAREESTWTSVAG
jgi:hypothetical protein